MPLPECFVIRPIDSRSENVLDYYVRPACEKKFDVVAAGDEPGATIKEAVLRALEGDLLVVAYLGRPAHEDNQWYWNGNVMFEVGYRLALKRPIVFLREARRDDEPLLPFDLADYRIVELPDLEMEQQPIHRRAAINKLGKHIDTIPAPPLPPRPTYPFAALTMEFDGLGARVTMANADAARLFQYESPDAMIGMDVRTLIEKISKMIAPSQREAFEKEQRELLGEVTIGNLPKASVCLVLGEKNLAQGETIPNAYVPFVLSFARQTGGGWQVVIGYLSVKTYAKLDPENVVRCSIWDDS